MNLDALIDSFKSMYTSAQEFVPKIAVGIALYIAGWLIAKIVSSVIKKALVKVRIDKLSEKVELDVMLSRLNPDLKLSGLLAKIIYYIILVIFLIAIADVLGLDGLKAAISNILAEAPKFFIALVIFVFGYYVSKLIQKAVYTATNTMGISGARVISNIVFYVIMVFVSITALEQTGMNTDLISNNITLIIGAILLAFAISYGIASRGIVGNMLSSYYGKGKFKVGQVIQINETSGKIEKIDSISVTLKKDDQLIVIPSKVLVENQVVILEDTKSEE